MRILAVDDDVLFLDFLKAELRQLDYQDVTCASSAREALKMIRSSSVPFECILLDIDMPGTNGIELCARLRLGPAAKTCPIIMITSMNQPQYMDQAFDAGASDFLAKPICSRELRGRLKMAKNQVRERKLRAKAEKASVVPISGKLSEPVHLKFKSSLSYAGFLRHMFETGSKDRFKSSVLCAHLSNTRELFAKFGFPEFVELLSDVGEMLSTAIGPEEKRLCYAGSGDFLVVVNSKSEFDQKAFSDALLELLKARRETYGECGWPLPHLKLGTARKGGLFTSSNPENLFADAIRDARLRGNSVSLRQRDLNETKQFKMRSDVTVAR